MQQGFLFFSDGQDQGSRRFAWFLSTPILMALTAAIVTGCNQTPPETKSMAHRGVPAAEQTAKAAPSSARLALFAQPADREQYEPFVTNPVHLTEEQPVATFSADVDTAAYANIRRMLRAGHMPPADAVRVEEMVNYFDYDYPVPDTLDQPFQITTAVLPSPWNADSKLLHIGIKGHGLSAEQRPKANLVFLVDVSGSMHAPNKLPLVKKSLRILVKSLRPDDMVSLVTYAGGTKVVLEPTAADRRHKIIRAIEDLQAGGGTAGGAGLQLAYDMAEENFADTSVNRIILATDGDFNLGIADPKALGRFVAAKRKSGIYLSAIGFGSGNLNDRLMQKIAQMGNGNAAYVDTLLEARKVMDDELNRNLYPIADDVKFQVEFNPARVAEYRLVGFETRMLRRQDFKNDRIDAGEIGSGHTVTAIFEITPAESTARRLEPLRYQANRSDDAKPAPSGEYAYVKVRYKKPGESKSRLLQHAVTRQHEHQTIAAATKDVRFSLAVAGFGQMLRDETQVDERFGYQSVLNLARNARGDDPFGYRGEFVQLVRLAQSMK